MMEERIIPVKESEIESVRKDLNLIKEMLLIRGITQKMSLDEEINQWEILSDQTLEDFEESLI